MRMRRKKNRDSRFENCIDLVATEPLENKGKWKAVFENENPIHLEIGCGKGGFILENAKRNPGINYVAMEKCLDALILALEKAKNENLTNVIYVCDDAEKLPEMFEKDEVSRIYLNFSDPWKKARQAKRRLTHRRFLEKYKQILVSDGEIHFKTDNRPLFDFSLEEFAETGVNVSELTYDLHNSEYNEGNIMTEYERTFSQKGFTINRCVLKF